MHQIRFRPGLHRGPRWGSLQRSPDPLASLREATSKGEREGSRDREGKREEREGTGPLSQIPGSAPANVYFVVTVWE